MRRVFAVFALVLFTAAALSACAAAGETAATGYYMGSVLSLRLYEKNAGDLADAIKADVQALDAEISATDPGSTLYGLNETGAAVFGPEGFRVLETAAALGKDSGGAVNIALGTVTSLWGFAGDAPRLPADEAIREGLLHTGLTDVSFDKDTLEITLQNGVRLDPGAIGKGAGCDLAAKRLTEKGIPAVVDFGGTVLVTGSRPGRPGWTVGVRDPFKDDGSYFATLSLTPNAETPAWFVSTSGSYEKNFTENGKTYHHILDPATGYPVETDLVSVTVVAPSGLAGDALSTALFVTGDTPAMRRVLEARGAGAVFVYKDGGVAVTPSLEGVFALSADGFTIV
ncbi:MAG: FAD:protein FMN transferase [Clostridia bacterium]|nr:FAD:protein FMN transferase [Clostridia bacterium]